MTTSNFRINKHSNLFRLSIIITQMYMYNIQNNDKWISIYECSKA